MEKGKRQRGRGKGNRGKGKGTEHRFLIICSDGNGVSGWLGVVHVWREGNKWFFSVAGSV